MMPMMPTVPVALPLPSSGRTLSVVACVALAAVGWWIAAGAPRLIQPASPAPVVQESRVIVSVTNALRGCQEPVYRGDGAVTISCGDERERAAVTQDAQGRTRVLYVSVMTPPRATPVPPVQSARRPP